MTASTTLSTSPSTRQSRYPKAVIMGGNLAGMVAARVLSDFFHEVIVLERDHYPEGYEHRKGVPQSRHPHFLLGAGRDALEQLFPGFTARMVANGAFFDSPGLSTVNLESGGWSPQADSPMKMLYSSRLVLDPTVRSFVRQIDNVRILEGHRAEAMLWNSDHSRITGVRVVNIDEERSDELYADLVVDACGRASRLTRWFEEAGLPPVPRMTLDAKCAYSTVWLEKPETLPDHIWWKSMAIQPLGSHAPAEHQFLGVILPTEHNRWIATIGSWNAYANMPTRFEDYLDIAKKMRTPWFHDVLTHCKPWSDVHMTKTTHNFWNRYDHWEKHISGIVALGDANQGFNPFYGQGMSCCARGGVILQQLLAEKSIYDQNFHQEFARRLNAYLEVPWALASGRDSVMEKAEGSEVLPDGFIKNLQRKMALPFFEIILRASRADKVIAVKFDELINIKISIREFMKNPAIVARIAWSELRYRLGILDEKLIPAQQAPAKNLF